MQPYAKALYGRFEGNAALVRATLHTDLFNRMREGGGKKTARRDTNPYQPTRSASFTA